MRAAPPVALAPPPLLLEGKGACTTLRRAGRPPWGLRGPPRPAPAGSSEPPPATSLTQAGHFTTTLAENGVLGTDVWPTAPSALARTVPVCRQCRGLSID